MAVGRDAEAQSALAHARDTLDAQARSGAANNVFWLSKAEYAALTSDFDWMIECLQKSIETGGIGVYGFPFPTFDRYRDETPFIAGSAACNAALRAKRAAGMPATGAEPHGDASPGVTQE